MMIISAIDIRNGKCVRLLQGRMDAETVFSNDPSAMARQWEDQAAEMLHVVDLNGAIEKCPQNLSSIQKIVQDIHIPVQAGGAFGTCRPFSSISISVLRKWSLERKPFGIHNWSGRHAKNTPDVLSLALMPERARVAID